jgi:flagellar basal body-associated protein FliL
MEDILLAQTISKPKPSTPDTSKTQTVKYQDDQYTASTATTGYEFQFPWVILVLLIVLVAGAGGAAYYYMLLLKRKDREDKSKHGVVFEIKFPRGNEI